jgi:multiple sugar transport system substrate-binding protein
MHRTNTPRWVKLAAAVGALALAGGVSAGAGQGGARVTAAPQSGQAKTVTLNFATWASNPIETKQLDQVLAGFKKKYPRIKVNHLTFEPGYPDTMLARFAAHKGPDVFYVNMDLALDWIRQGVLKDLGPLIKKYHFSTAPFYPKLLSAFQYKGKTYGFPKDWSPLAMETNNALLAKAKVKPPRTWAQLKSAATKLKTAVPDGRPICLSANWDRLMAFVYENKGTFINASKTKSTVNTPAVKAAADYYVGLIKQKLAGTPAQLGVDWCGEALGKGKSAIIFEGNWLLPYMKDTFPSVKYKTTKMVKNKAEGNLAFTNSYSMAKETKHQGEAWTLLVYLSGKTGSRIWTSKGLALPARKDVKPISGRQNFVWAAPFAHPYQFAPKFSKVLDVSNNELSAVIEGKKSTADMLKKIQQTANDALK